MRLFIIFLTVPIVEIYLLLKVGQKIGTAATIALIILTAFIGSALIKSKGIKVINSLRTSNLTDPNQIIKAIADGLFIVISGVLLLTPGFATDIFGLLLFFNKTRQIISNAILKKIKPISGGRFNFENFDDLDPRN